MITETKIGITTIGDAYARIKEQSELKDAIDLYTKQGWTIMSIDLESQNTSKTGVVFNYRFRLQMVAS